MLTLLMVFFTTTSVSCTSVDFSLRAEAEAKTLSLERNWFEVGSASSSRFSGDSSSRWNFFTLKMLELEMDSCSSSCLLYILIFSFSLSRVLENDDVLPVLLWLQDQLLQLDCHVVADPV